MPDYRLYAKGLDEYERKLAQLATAILDLRPFWPRVVPLFIGWMREQFTSEGEWGGDPWEPLTETYAARKEREFPGKGILVATSDLRKAASTPARTAFPNALILTIVDPKVEYHQEGTDDMPARPLVPEFLPAAAVVELDEAAQLYVDEWIVRLGLGAGG